MEINKTIISFTSISLNKDSRTLKMAATFASQGIRSIVVERNTSDVDYSYLGIELISLNSSNVQKNLENENTNNCIKKANSTKIIIMSGLKAVRNSTGKLRLRWVKNFISYLHFLRIFKKQYAISPKYLPKADIYYFHSYEFTHLAFKLPKCAQIIYDAHDFYSELFPLNSYSSLIRYWILPYQKRLEKKLIDRTNIFITVSNGIAQKYKSYCLKKPHVIRNFHDNRLDVQVSTDVRVLLQANENSFIVCIVGNCKSGMACRESISAFLKLPKNDHLVFIGSGYENLAYKHSNIHFIGPLQPNEIVPFIKTADCGLINYFDFTEDYKYALPNRFFQMLAARLPLLYPKQLLEIDNLNKIYNFGTSVDIKCIEDIYENLKFVKIHKNLLKEKMNKNAAISEMAWEKEEINLMNLLK